MVQVLSHELLCVDDAAQKQVRRAFSVLLDPVSDLFVDCVEVSAHVRPHEDPRTEARSVEEGKGQQDIRVTHFARERPLGGESELFDLADVRLVFFFVMFAHLLHEFEDCFTDVVILVVEATDQVWEHSTFVVLFVWQLNHQICHCLIEELSNNSRPISNEHCKVVKLSCVFIEVPDRYHIWITEPNHMFHNIRIKLPQSTVEYLMERFKPSYPDFCVFVGKCRKQAASHPFREVEQLVSPV